MRCAILTRVSTEEQTRPEYNSLQTQAEICRAYVEVHREDGWEVTKVYEDAGFSGKTLKRPALQALLHDVRSGLIDVVLTYKIDRISRSLRDFYEFWGVLQSHGAIFVSATQSFDTSTPAGVLMLNVLLSFAQYERELTVERTSTKMRARAEKGMWNGGYIPFGYAYDPEQQLLTPDPEEAKVVRLIYDAVIQHCSLARARDAVNAAGHRTKCRTLIGRNGEARTIGGRPWTHTAIKTIITRPVYRGCTCYQGEVFEGKHEGIIEDERWQLANDLVGSPSLPLDRSGRGPDKYVHLLKGLLRCHHCGAAITPYPSGKFNKDGEPYLYYACVRRIKEGPQSGCPLPSFSARHLERSLIAALAALARDPEMMRQSLRAGVASSDDDRGRSERRMERLVGDLAKTERKIARLVGVLEETDEPPEALRLRCRDLESERLRLRAEIARLDTHIADVRAKSCSPEDAAAYLSDLTASLSDLSLPEQKTLIQSSIGGITVNQSEDIASQHDRQDRGFGVLGRTRRVTVTVQIRGKAPERSGGGPESKEPNFDNRSSALEVAGSPRRTIVRTSRFTRLSRFRRLPRQPLQCPQNAA